jgi:transposase
VDEGEKPLFPPQSPAVVRKTLDHLIHVTPPNHSRWMLERIREAVSWLRGRSVVCVWKTLRRLGIVYKRGREYMHSPDPDYALKLAYIEAARHQAQRQPEHVILLYEDEITYYRRPTLACGYALVGSTELKARLGYTTNKKRRIAGSLNAMMGQFYAQLMRYYQQLEMVYPHVKTIYLVQDNWPVHRHPRLLNFFLTSRIVPLFLPTYAPWTNPTEKVRLRLKRDGLHLHPFQDNCPIWFKLSNAG